MSLPISLPGLSKNVLLVGDEGVSIFNVTGGGVKYIDHLAWLTPDFENKLTDTLRKDCPKKPIVILYDMVEQHYRKESVPKVGAMDKANVVKRKVAITFPNYKMRAALPLKSKKGVESESKALGASPYLFAAVPSSELMSSLLRGVISSGLPISGLYLLPVEGVGLVNKLAKKIPSKKSKSRWTLLMGQHSSGNLRQIVVRDGELALTRMTPFSEAQDNVEAWGQSIFREFKVTISYLSRLGYSPDDGIDVVLIGSEEATSFTADLIPADMASLFPMTVDQAATHSGIKTNVHQEADFADILYVAWAGQTNSFALPMSVESLGRATRPRMIANTLMLAGTVGLLWFLFQAGLHTSEFLSVRADLQEREAQLRGAQETYAQLLDEKQREGYDIRLYKGAFAAEAELNAFALKPFSVLKGISLALGPVLSIDDIVIRHDDNTAVKFKNLDMIPSNVGRQFSINGLVPNNNDEYRLYSKLSLTFASSVPQEEAQRILTNLVKQMEQRLPEYDVSILKAVRDRVYEYDVEGQIGAQNNEPEIKEDNTAVIEIRGAV